LEFFEATGDADLQLVLIRDGAATPQQLNYFFDPEK
jgi:hypothetical protein